MDAKGRFLRIIKSQNLIFRIIANINSVNIIVNRREQGKYRNVLNDKKKPSSLIFGEGFFHFIYSTYNNVCITLINNKILVCLFTLNFFFSFL